MTTELDEDDDTNEFVNEVPKKPKGQPTELEKRMKAVLEKHKQEGLTIPYDPSMFKRKEPKKPVGRPLKAPEIAVPIQKPEPLPVPKEEPKTEQKNDEAFEELQIQLEQLTKKIELLQRDSEVNRNDIEAVYGKIQDVDDEFSAVQRDIQLIASYAGRSNEARNDGLQRIQQTILAVSSEKYEISDQIYMLKEALHIATMTIDTMSAIEDDIKRALNVMTEKLRNIKQNLEQQSD